MLLSNPSNLAYTVADIGGANSEAWLGIANTLATAAIAPFAGSISDLVGRRWVAMIGAVFVLVGSFVVGFAHRMPVAIGGTTLIGVGGGLAELIAYSGMAELAPVKSRGLYIGTLTLILIPFSGASAYGTILSKLTNLAQLYSASSSWRWGAWISLVFSGLAIFLTFFFYHPPPRENTLGLTKREIIAKIDFVGGFLVTSGFALFLLGLQWAGST